MPRAYDRPFIHVFCISPCKQHSVSCLTQFILITFYICYLFYSAPANPAHDRLYDGKCQKLLLFDQPFLLRILQLVALCVLVLIKQNFCLSMSDFNFCSHTLQRTINTLDCCYCCIVSFVLSICPSAPFILFNAASSLRACSFIMGIHNACTYMYTLPLFSWGEKEIAII